VEHGGAHGAIVRLESGTLAIVRMQAAVLREAGQPVRIEDVELEAPHAGEALVRIAACGVCASDLHVVDGEIPEPLPIVLGHEASGVVVDTGPGVERVRPGDHVVLALVPSCGECETCRRGRPNFCELGGRMAATGTLADGTSRLSAGDETLHHFNSVSSFAEYAVVPESVAVPVRQDVPLDVAALLGCAVLTGWGAVRRIAAVESGASVAIWGCGGVGLAAIQAARLAGAEPIVAVDTRPEKLALAERLGATATVAARTTADTARRVRRATGGGPDYAIEAIGREETIREAWEALRPGGTVVVVGLPPKGSTLTIDTWGFINEKAIRGCFLGSARIDEDIPQLVDLYASGDLLLDELVTLRVPLSELPAAFERLRQGEVVRQLVVF
jgi:S-(hydroxymethyl)glutathione dehydrogenase/alcohol dehydrogenase